MYEKCGWKTKKLFDFYLNLPDLNFNWSGEHKSLRKTNDFNTSLEQYRFSINQSLSTKLAHSKHLKTNQCWLGAQASVILEELDGTGPYTTKLNINGYLDAKVQWTRAENLTKINTEVDTNKLSARLIIFF